MLNEPLYHYTTTAGLKGILGSKSIWATHYRYLNDTKEINYGIEKVLDLLFQEVGNYGGRYQGAMNGSCLFRNIINPKISDDQFSRFMNWSANACGDADQIDYIVNFTKYSILKNLHCFAASEWKEDFFIASFCNDGDLLNQWRGYAGRGGGYAIQFSQANQSNLSNVTRANNPFKLYKVLYRSDEQSADLTNYINETLNLIPSKEYRSNFARSKEHDISEMIEVKNRTFKSMSERIGNVVLGWKDRAFSSEGESRLVGSFAREILPDGIEFRQSSKLLVPYIPVSLENLGLQITKIRFGPDLDPGLAEHSTKLLLKKYGHDNVEVVKSSVPYSESRH